MTVLSDWGGVHNLAFMCVCVNACFWMDLVRRTRRVSFMWQGTHCEVGSMAEIYIGGINISMRTKA